MIPTEKMRQLATDLLEKTATDQAIWTTPASGNIGGYSVDAILRLPQSVVALRRWTSDSSPDVIRLSLYSDDSRVVGGWSVEEGEPDWDLLVGLHNEASRVVTGWDKVLADVEKAVRSKEPIGTR